MAYHKSAKQHAKTEELKTKVPLSVFEKVEAAAAEDGVMRAKLVREAILHYLTMREVKRRIRIHRSNDHMTA